MKKSFLRVGALSAALLAALGFSLFSASCSGGGDNPVVLPTANDSHSSSKTLYKASSNLSDYAKKAVSALGYSSYSASKARGAAPDVFVVKGSDLASLPYDKAILALKTCIEGKTLVIDGPTEQNVRDFGARLDSALDHENDALLRAQAKLDDDAPNQTVYQLVSALSDDDGADSHSLTHAAIGICGGHIYYVHDFSDEAQDFVDESAKRFSNWIRGADAISASAQIDAIGRSLIAKSDAGASSLDDFVKSQVFTHSLVGWDDSYKVPVDATTYVWTVCNLETQKDYYLVKNSLTFHNEANPTAALYFANCEVSPCVLSADPSKTSTLVPEKCSPSTSQGSESFTSGSSVTDGENHGVTFGLTPGINFATGLTFSESLSYTATITHSETTSVSSTTSMPDVSVELTTGTTGGQEYPHWIFETPRSSDGTLKKVQKNTVTFETYSLFKLDSGVGNADGTVELATMIDVGFYTGNGSGTMTYGRFDDHIRKPCNSKGQYLMSFDRPAGMNDSQMTACHNILKEYMSDWRSSIDLYAVGQDHLDCMAESCFDAVCGKIETNKNIFQGRGFKGKFNFFIQNKSAGTKVKSREIEF